MSDNETQDAKDQAVETVVERVESYDEGAQPETVERDLREGLADAEVDLPDDQVEGLAEQIHQGDRPAKDA